MSGSRKRLIRLPIIQWSLIVSGLILTQSVLWALAGFVAFYSALLGGLIYAVPNAYFTRRAFRYQGARQAPMMVSELFRGEAMKFLLTAIFFAAVFLLIEPVHVPALLFTFAVMVVTGGVIPWIVQPQKQP